TLPANSSVTYTVAAAIKPDATGSLTNTATVSQASDVTPGNNGATDTDTLTPQADVSITKTDSPDPVLPAGTIQYTITVDNTNGPSDVVGASVQDMFDSTAFSSVSWMSAVSGGATATASGSGDINDTVNLPKGSSIVYTVTAVLSAGFSGSSVEHPATGSP